MHGRRWPGPGRHGGHALSCIVCHSAQQSLGRRPERGTVVVGIRVHGGGQVGVAHLQHVWRRVFCGAVSGSMQHAAAHGPQGRRWSPVGRGLPQHQRTQSTARPAPATLAYKALGAMGCACSARVGSGAADRHANGPPRHTDSPSPTGGTRAAAVKRHTSSRPIPARPQAQRGRDPAAAAVLQRDELAI